MDNKDMILKKALDLFSRTGYEGTGIQQICESAGITKPTLYHYFGSKKGLFESIVVENNRVLLNALEKAADYKHDIVNNIQNVTAAYFKYAAGNRDYYRTVLSSWFYPEESEIHSIVKSANNAQFELVRDMFLQAVPDHGNMRGRHIEYAYSLIGTINTYIGIYFGGEIKLDSEAVFRLSKQFMHGIFS